MKNILILVLIVFLALEGFSFWLVAQQTGWFVAIWFAIIISIIGFSLLKKSINKLKAEAMSGIMPADDQFIFSAILLVIPGYFSDVLALVVLLPVVRRWMRNLLLLLVAKKYGFDPSLLAAMQNMGSQMGANGMGGMNMNDMASMFGHMDPNEFMKNMGAHSKSNSASSNNNSRRFAAKDDEIIECEECEGGYRAKAKDD